MKKKYTIEEIREHLTKNVHSRLVKGLLRDLTTKEAYFIAGVVKGFIDSALSELEHKE